MKSEGPRSQVFTSRGVYVCECRGCILLRWLKNKSNSNVQIFT